MLSPKLQNLSQSLPLIIMQDHAQDRLSKYKLIKFVYRKTSWRPSSTSSRTWPRSDGIWLGTRPHLSTWSELGHLFLLPIDFAPDQPLCFTDPHPFRPLSPTIFCGSCGIGIVWQLHQLSWSVSGQASSVTFKCRRHVNCLASSHGFRPKPWAIKFIEEKHGGDKTLIRPYNGTGIVKASKTNISKNNKTI